MDKLDLLLQKNPISVPVKEQLAQNTMEAMIQVRRVRLAKRMLVGLVAITTLLLIVKWLNNDLLYFIELAMYKIGFIKSQSTLYFEAFFESLPKQQIIT